MSDRSDELEQARRAKAKALETLAGRCELSSVGITRSGGRYAVQVNLEHEPEEALPSEIDGVRLVVKVTGPIRKQSEE